MKWGSPFGLSGKGESLPARRRHGSLDLDLDHGRREALASITQDNVDQKDHMEQPSNVDKLEAPGSHAPTQELSQGGLLPLLHQGPACREGATVYSGEIGNGHHRISSDSRVWLPGGGGTR